MSVLSGPNKTERNQRKFTPTFPKYNVALATPRYQGIKTLINSQQCVDISISFVLNGTEDLNPGITFCLWWSSKIHCTLINIRNPSD